LVSDPVYSSPLVTQLVNKVLEDGKKSLAERIVYGAMEGCREKTGTDAAALHLDRRLDVVKRALQGDHRVGAGLLAAAFHGAVDDPLSGGKRLLAVLKHLV